MYAAGMAQAAEGQVPALPEDDQREQDEPRACDPVGRQHRRPALARRRERPPDPLGRERHVEMGDAERRKRVHDRVHHRGGIPIVPASPIPWRREDCAVKGVRVTISACGTSSAGTA